MENELTLQELDTLVQNVQAAFDSVTVAELEQPDPALTGEDGLRLDYELRNGHVLCVITRQVLAGGKAWRLRMVSPLAGNALPEEKLSAREVELFHDELNRDFLTGVFNRNYLETVFRTRIERSASAGIPAAVALVRLDYYEQLLDQYGYANIDQVLCFAANQWKKHFSSYGLRSVCRLGVNTFVVGCVGLTGAQLAEEMTLEYKAMPHECVTTASLMQRIPFTLTIACAGTDQVEQKTWPALYELCEAAVHTAAAQGGNRVVLAGQPA